MPNARAETLPLTFGFQEVAAPVDGLIAAILFLESLPIMLKSPPVYTTPLPDTRA
jgi:TRAP-type C4-dicarboxylate transport system permease small subunit